MSHIFNRAIVVGHIKVISVILQHGAHDINARVDFGNTALHFAARWGRTKIAELLLNFGCDINSINDNGETALHIAYMYKKGNVIETLLEYCADVNINNSHSFYARYISPEFFDEFDRFYRKYDFRDNVLNNHFVKMKVAKIYLNPINL